MDPSDTSTPSVVATDPSLSDTLLSESTLDGLTPTEELWAESTGIYDDARESLLDDTMVGAPAYDLVPRFTGRDDVIDALWQHVEQARSARESSFVLLLGEPGMGKSRTIEELAMKLAIGSTARLFAGSGDGAGVPYSAFAHLFARRFAIPPGVGADATREYIVRGVSGVLPSARVTEVAHLLAHLMGVPMPSSPVVGPLAGSPRQLETRMFIAVRRFLAADAENGPLALVIEDLEQCGVETVNLLRYLAAGLASCPVVLVGTARAQVFERHPSIGEGDIPLHRIELAPLSAGRIGDLMRELCAPLSEIPAELEQKARSLGGSPRALLELMHLLLENDVIVRDPERGWVLDEQALAATTLPDSYEQLVALRLEVMADEDYQLLSMAAIIGETFWLDAVVALMRAEGIDEQQPDGPTLAQIAKYGDRSRIAVQGALTRLCEHDWIVPIEESSVPGEHEYRFAYPHLHKMVLASIDDDARRDYHRSAARWLEVRPEGRWPLGPEDIAHHLQEAGYEVEAAVRYQRAADRARSGYFNSRAILLYMRAINCIGARDPVMRMQLWHDLGEVYQLKGDFEAALGAFERLLRLAWLVAARNKAAVAFNKMGRVWRRKGSPEMGLEYLRRGAELFEQTGDEAGIADSLDDIGRVLYLLGRYDDAFEQANAGLARRGDDDDPRSIANSMSNLGNIQRARGNFVEARQCHAQALARRRSSGDRSGVISSLNNIAVIDYEQGDHVRARAGWVQALSDAGAIGALPLAALILSNLGELALSENDHDEARRRLEEALSLANDLNDRRLQVEVSRNLALAEVALGRVKEARELATRSYELAAAAGLRDSEGRALICMGRVLSASLFDSSGDEVKQTANRYFELGLGILRELRSESEIARALEAYGRYKLEHDDRRGGVTMLMEAGALYDKLGMRRKQEIDKLLAAV